jgi:hypothetical protein
VGVVVASQQDFIVRNHGIVIRQYAVDRLIEGIIVAGRLEIEVPGQR